MNPILEHVRDHLLKFTLVPHVVGDGEAMAVQVSLTHVVSTLVFQADMDPPLLSVSARVPVLVPAERRAAVVEFFMRINHGLRVGRFLLDYQDGEACLRMEVEADVANLTDQRISRYVLLCMRMVDGYFPALMNVIYRGTSPVQAVEQGEAEFAAVTSKGQEEEREA